MYTKIDNDYEVVSSYYNIHLVACSFFWDCLNSKHSDVFDLGVIDVWMRLFDQNVEIKLNPTQSNVFAIYILKASDDKNE